ncbi:phage portal protein [Streptomyces sp. NPDC060027]|uniref:phage portal protein n=1 Tax=Streptomyces sp. NPDC060027 TaxID=3347040 RepID=UPI0036ADFF3C
MAGTPDLINAYAELSAARPAYAKAEAYFDGDVEEIFASDKVAKMLKKSNLDELDEVNFARIPVTAVTNRLHVTAVTTGDEDADADIGELFKRNQLDEEIPGLHVRACSMGDAYLMVWPELDERGDVEGVDMFVNGPGTVRVIYDTENPLTKAFAIKSWNVGTVKKPVIRADLYYADRVERWVWDGKHSQKNDRWTPYTGDDQDWTLPNPYGEVPFFHYRTARPYGRPEHYAAYGPQAIINKLVVSHAATVDYQSLPQRYGLIDPTLDQSGQQSDFDPDNPEDVGGDPESPLNGSQLRNDPGEFWQLQGYRTVGQFEAANPDIYMKPFDRYIKAMAQVTDTPMHIFDSTGDRISGESRREANGPLIAKVQSRQRSFGATHADAFEFALRLLGYDDDITVTVAWAPAEQVSDAEGWATIKAKIDAGVPRERALIEAGYAPEIVSGWLANLDDDAELQRRVELLATLGDAVQRLGSGVALGAVTQEQVATILDGVLAAAQRTDRELTAGG